MRTTGQTPINPSLELPAQLKELRMAKGKSIVDMALATGLSRLTVSAAEGKSDARLSTVAALFDTLGYTLMPVPKAVAPEVANFINNGGTTVSLPAGVSAPLSSAQQAFRGASAMLNGFIQPSLLGFDEAPDDSKDLKR